MAVAVILSEGPLPSVPIPAKQFRGGFHSAWVSRGRSAQQLIDLDTLWYELSAEAIPNDVHELDEVLCE